MPIVSVSSFLILNISGDGPGDSKHSKVTVMVNIILNITVNIFKLFSKITYIYIKVFLGACH